MHDISLITTIVGGFGAAFVFGAIAQRLKISPLVGYLIAGIAVGPATPGIMADPDLAGQLAEIGVILLMFGVGLHFSIGDLLSVRNIAVPGALVQITLATLLGVGLAFALGWSLPAGLVFGLALSVASTVVLLRALQERRLVETEQGRIAVGWLVVEDLAMVLALVLLPSLGGLVGHGSPEGTAAASGNMQPLLILLAITLGKVVAFVALMLVVGRRVVPWILHAIAHTGSRELFRLAVLAIALGMAYAAAELFGVSFALGAFFAGMILSESALSQRAAEESLPFRDAFAVLFFVSVGMLFDPRILWSEPLSVLAVVAIVLLGKSIGAYLIVRVFGYSNQVALTISVSLAQVGEFSFILAGLGVELGLLPEDGRDLILAGAIVSIIVNPFLFDLLQRFRPAAKPASAATAAPGQAPEEIIPTALIGHAVIVGYGRVGSAAGEMLAAAGRPFFVIEESPKVVDGLRARGIEAISGNAVRDEIAGAAGIPAAAWLLVAIPEAYEASQIVRHARTHNPSLVIIARAHFDAEVEHLQEQGANVVIMGEREIARGMVERVLAGARAKPPFASETKPAGESEAGSGGVAA